LEANRVARVATAAVVGFVVLGSFYVAMERGDRNENMSVTAAGLLLEGKRMYVDFTYLQMPYLPYVYSWLRS
jgi:hypothetical protein